MGVKIDHMLTLPECHTPEANAHFRKHVAGLAGSMAAAANDYIEKARQLAPEDCPDPKSIGTACFVVSFLLSIGLTDAEKQELSEALVAVLLLNEPSSGTFKLATLPQPENVN